MIVYDVYKLVGGVDGRERHMNLGKILRELVT